MSAGRASASSALRGAFGGVLHARDLLHLLAGGDAASDFEAEHGEGAADRRGLRVFYVRSFIHVAVAADFEGVASGGGLGVVRRAVDFGADEDEAGLLVVFEYLCGDA